jgi:hypothetical protein
MAFGCRFPEHVGDGLGGGVEVAGFGCLGDFLVGWCVGLHM